MRANLILLAVLAACAIGLITSQHHARRLFTQLEQEASRARALDVEYGQLQLEQTTWSMHSRVERIAGERLHMRPADVRRTQLIPAAPQSTPSSVGMPSSMTVPSSVHIPSRGDYTK